VVVGVFFFLLQEIQAVLTFLVLFVVKIVKEENWETCIADSLLYAKGLLLAVTLVIDYWLTVSYLLGFVGMNFFFAILLRNE
jgi:hypothetical protein